MDDCGQVVAIRRMEVILRAGTVEIVAGTEEEVRFETGRVRKLLRDFL